MTEREELIQNACLAADLVAAAHFQGPEVDRTRAIIERAIDSLIGNGLIEVKPKSEWPEWFVMDPPYAVRH